MTEGKFHAVHENAKKIKKSLEFNSEQIGKAEDFYVVWLDIMGAGHTMSTSINKTANFIVRLHLAVEVAVDTYGFSVRRLPINDGLFLISDNKAEIVTVVRHALAMLVANFVETPRPHDRFFC